MIRSCPALLISAPASGQGKTTVTAAEILQPGPAARTDGLSQIRRIIRRWSEETEP